MLMDLINKVIELATSIVALIAAVVKAVPVARDKRSRNKKDRRR